MKELLTKHFKEVLSKCSVSAKCILIISEDDEVRKIIKTINKIYSDNNTEYASLDMPVEIIDELIKDFFLAK